MNVSEIYERGDKVGLVFRISDLYRVSISSKFPETRLSRDLPSGALRLNYRTDNLTFPVFREYYRKKNKIKPNGGEKFKKVNHARLIPNCYKQNHPNDTSFESLNDIRATLDRDPEK